jgi:NAD-dependent deacetylase
MTTIVVFTGAGVSAESGLKTFRDHNGLWENHDVHEVASLHGFRRNPQLVWRFYRERHFQLETVKPNAAHVAIAEFERYCEEKGIEFVLITQNVDRLHRRAGSKNVLELHGNLHDLKCSSTFDCPILPSIEEVWASEQIVNCEVCNGKYRPDIVWFGEILPEKTLAMAAGAAERASHFVTIGTSGDVYPAADLPFTALYNGSFVYEVNPKQNWKFQQLRDHPFYKWIPSSAATAVPAVLNEIKRIL